MLLGVFEEKAECYVEQKSTNLPRIASKNSKRATHAVILLHCHCISTRQYVLQKAATTQKLVKCINIVAVSEDLSRLPGTHWQVLEVHSRRPID